MNFLDDVDDDEVQQQEVVSTTSAPTPTETPANIDPFARAATPGDALGHAVAPVVGTVADVGATSQQVTEPRLEAHVGEAAVPAPVQGEGGAPAVIEQPAPEPEEEVEPPLTGPVVEDAVISLASDISRRANDLVKLVDDPDSVNVLPEALVDYLLKRAGCEVVDDRITKLVALEVQNYVLQILEDIKSTSVMRTRASAPGKKQKRDKSKTEEEVKEEKEKKYVLIASELEAALRSRRVAAAQAPFHSSS